MCTGQDSSGTPAPQLREESFSAKRLEEAYIDVACNMYKLHQDCHLVHGDLSEYNMLCVELPFFRAATLLMYWQCAAHNSRLVVEGACQQRRADDWLVADA
jgi:hypothetical protein